MSAYGLLTVYNITAKLGTSQQTSAWTYEDLGAGIDNVAEALNEVVQQYFFLVDQGFARNHVTGMAPAYTFTGRRVIGDPVQEFIFGAKYGLDTERQSSIELSYVNDESATVTITCDCTICNIQEFSGASTDDSAISFEIRFDGKPEVTTTPGG